MLKELPVPVLEPPVGRLDVLLLAVTGPTLDPVDDAVEFELMPVPEEVVGVQGGYGYGPGSELVELVIGAVDPVPIESGVLDVLLEAVTGPMRELLVEVMLT